MAVEKQFCTFTLNDYLFGIEVLTVQEVFRYQEMTSVPLASPEVRGLINLRGQIITAIDLRRRLNFEPLPNHRQPMNVVVRNGNEATSLLVDEIGDVLNLPLDAYEPPPENLDENTRDLIEGVYKLKDKLMLVLDIGKVVGTEPERERTQETSVVAREDG